MPTTPFNCLHKLRCALVAVPLSTTAVGCAGKQDYRVVAPQNADELITRNAVVLEGTIVDAKRTRQSWVERAILLWQPVGPSEQDVRHDATIAIKRTLDGDPGETTVQLSNYRPLTLDELKLLPDAKGFHVNSLVRIGFDARFAGRLQNLAIVPLGNTPEFDAMSDVTASIRSRYEAIAAATRVWQKKPSTKPSH